MLWLKGHQLLEAPRRVWQRPRLRLWRAMMSHGWAWGSYTAGMLPVFDMTTDEGRAGAEALLGRLRSTASLSGEQAGTVAEVIEAVRTRGDAALVECMRRWTDPGFEADRIRVSGQELELAAEGVDPKLLTAVDRAVAHVREYQRHILPRSVKPVSIGGAELGLRFGAVDSAGLCVPGGTAVLFSTLVMLAVPALVAGVAADRIAVVCPPPTRRGGAADGGSDSRADSGADSGGGGDISPIVLAVAHRLGLSRVYRIGGAQAVAALAYGTERVEAVDLIAGPGNVYVQLAKAMVAGHTGTDNGFYGPSEIVTVVDDSANPAYVAAGLIAQAEHDPGKCFLLGWSREVIDAVLSSLAEQLPKRGRVRAIHRALERESGALVCADRDEAVAWANRLASEHVNLAVADPDWMLTRLRHAGEVFLGHQTPVAAGDYYAGPSHCLPTGTTARFTGGVSVYTFLKRTGTVAYPDGLPAQAVEDIARMAEAEGLDGHAQSVRLRGG